jgi:polysaccharide deacetylase 2 family uncharacterized protein YibQ
MSIRDRLKSVTDKVQDTLSIRAFLLTFILASVTLTGFVVIQQAFFTPPKQEIVIGEKVIAVAQKTVIEEPLPTPTPAPVTQPEESIAEEPQPTISEPVITETPEPVAEKPVEPIDTPPPAQQEIEDSIAGLSEETSFGSLPIIRTSDKLTSFEAYKQQFFVKSDTKGVIALVMIDYGLSNKLSRLALSDIPAPLSFVASPYADNLQAKISEARRDGHEVWLQIPVESGPKAEMVVPGENFILSGLKPKQNVDRLNTHLGKATGYAGVAFTYDTAFTDSSPELQMLMNAIATRGLGVAQLDNQDLTIPIAAGQANARFIQGHTKIDDILVGTEIIKSLEKLEKIALEEGVAVAYFSPSALTFTILKSWQQSLSGKNIQLAPLTYAVKVKRVP